MLSLAVRLSCVSGHEHVGSVIFFRSLQCIAEFRLRHWLSVLRNFVFICGPGAGAAWFTEKYEDVPQGPSKDGGSPAGVVARYESTCQRQSSSQAYPSLKACQAARAPSRSNRQLHPHCRRVSSKGRRVRLRKKRHRS